MAHIIKNLRGFVCDEREKNWSKEFLTFELKKHKDAQILEHPDFSVTTKKLADGCITEEKLSEEMQDKLACLSANIENLGISHTNDINSIRESLKLKADKCTSLSGYGIEDAYTKSETYSKAETDKLLENKEDFVIKAEIKTALDSYGNISYSVICSTTKEEIMKAFNDKKNIRLDATDKSFNGIRKLSYVGYRMGGYAVFCGTFNDGKTVVIGLDENGWYINVSETYTKSEIDNLILGSWEALV